VSKKKCLGIAIRATTITAFFLGFIGVIYFMLDNGCDKLNASSERHNKYYDCVATYCLNSCRKYKNLVEHSFKNVTDHTIACRCLLTEGEVLLHLKGNEKCTR
jgi:hypothetical protein